MTTPDTLEMLRRGALENDNAYRGALELLIWLGKDIPTVNAYSGPWLFVDVDELERRAGAWSGGERRIVAVAVSLLSTGRPVDLSWVFDGNLGGAHLHEVNVALRMAGAQ
jgi:hypothetical protein